MRYLFLTYYTKPNGQIDEAMSLSNRLRPKDLQTVNVILDFKKLEVVKCSLRDATVPKDWDRISSYYYKFYPAIMERLFVENGHPVLETPES
jgi:hypothetical protein